MTLGNVLDWLIQNATAIGLIISFIVFVIKIAKTLEHIKISQKSMKESLDDITKQDIEKKKIIESLSSGICDLKSKVSSLQERLSHAESMLEESTQRAIVFRSSIASIESILSKLEATDLEDVERNRVLLRSLRASLMGLIEIGANGPVKESLSQLDDYLFKMGS